MHNPFPPVSELLPHRPPMILIDQVIAYDPPTITCTVCTRSAYLPKSGPGEISLAVGYEWMAQTIGAYVGLTAKLANHSIKIGFLLGTRRAEFFTDCFKEHQAITCCTKLLGHFDELGVFDSELFAGKTLLMRGQIKVYQPNDVEDFFNTRKAHR